MGPAIVNAAIRGNHRITLYNRGITNPGLFPNLRLIQGDRESGISAYESLRKEKWDVVIDVWPEVSRLVDEATQALTGYTHHYIFISSIAVYDNYQEVGLTEESDVVSLQPALEMWGYSEEKLNAENIIRNRFPEHHTILRAGPIKGWRDTAMDLLYWCIKLNRDNRIIAPGSGNDPLQFIDVKDVGGFAIQAAEKNLRGTYNVTGPRNEQLLWKEFLTTAKKHFKSKTELIWASEDFLRQNNIQSFTDLPLWAPLSEDRGFMQISNNKLRNTGFQFTPFVKTFDDCLNWYKKGPNSDIKFGTPETGVGIERSREQKLIKMITQ